MRQGRLLIAEQDADAREACVSVLGSAGYAVDTATSEAEVIHKARAWTYDLFVQSLEFPPDGGISLLRKVKQARPSLMVVIVAGNPDVQDALQAFRSGAFDLIERPVTPLALLDIAQRALEAKRLGERRSRLADELHNERLRVIQLQQELAQSDPFAKLIGLSPSILDLIETIREVARTDSTVLLTGESGTGKGLVARTIHYASQRRRAPFVEANCVVYSEGLLHSELFGHERGAFTGAARTKKGRFELARGGTLFLDEIGEISHSTQLLLLRVLQDRTFERVGGEITLEADVRLIAATNSDLMQAMHNGRLRADLFYRLNVIPIDLPPLRERPDDIPLLARHFLARCGERMGQQVEGFSAEAVAALTHYGWPGNVRELENLVERVVALHRSPVVELQDLPSAIRERARSIRVASCPGTLQSLEKLRIEEALREADGNKKRAARLLGIHRSTLYAKMGRYGLRDAAEEEKGRDSGQSLSGYGTRAASG